MKNGISLKGVCTNNLKNISVQIPYNEITAIAGPSGGGKSSLAYQTLYSFCSREFRSLEDGYLEASEAVLDSCSGAIPAVAVRQLNKNINPHSTLYSYLNLASVISQIKDERISNVPFRFLKLNSPGNECLACGGSGREYRIDLDKIIDGTKKIKDQPFMCWYGAANDKYLKILIAYCEDAGIDLEKPFFRLSKSAQKALLFSESSKKFSISFKYNGKYRKRASSYIGAFKFLDDKRLSKNVSDRKSAIKFLSNQVCASCNGSRINCEGELGDCRIFGMKYCDFLTSDVDSILKSARQAKFVKSKNHAVLKFIDILSAISELGVSYLSLTRSIPSLSGGELQKLIFSRLLTTQINNILIVIDEISSQVHVSDYPNIVGKIKLLKKRANTVVIVDHCDYFIENADSVLFVGPGSGKQGGEICNYMAPAVKCVDKNNFKLDQSGLIELPAISRNNVKNISLKIPKNSITGICGKSGSGKSSYVAGLAEILDCVELVSQSSIKGNIRSTIASYMELSKPLAEWFSQCSKQPVETYLASTGKIGACEKCEGRGVVQYIRAYEETISITCDLCDGNAFSSIANGFKMHNYSISDVYSTSLDEMEGLGLTLPSVVERFIEVSKCVGLGHLSLSRRTSTLSGGELKRLKLAFALMRRSKGKILVIDEPGSGLDDVSIAKVMNFLESKKNDYQAIIVIDHKPAVFTRSDYLVEFGPGSGINGGKVSWSGNPVEYYRSSYLKYLGQTVG